MPNKCAVIGCMSFTRSRFTAPHISLHKFPRSVTMHKVWMRMIGRVDFVPNINSHVCSLHFRSKDFIKESTDKNISRIRSRGTLKLFSRRLKKNAIPCIRMGVDLSNVLPRPSNKKNAARSEISGIQKRVEMGLDTMTRPYVEQQRENQAVALNADDTDGDVVVLDVIRAEKNYRELAANVRNGRSPLMADEAVEQRVQGAKCKADQSRMNETRAVIRAEMEDDDLVVLDVIPAKQNQTLGYGLDGQVKTETPKTDVVRQDLIRASEPNAHNNSAPVPDSNAYCKFSSLAGTIMDGLKKGAILPTTAADSITWLETMRSKCSEKYKEEMEFDPSENHTITRLSELNEMDKKIRIIKNMIA